MAKGQQHGNREIRKPKQDKHLPKAESPFGNPKPAVNEIPNGKRKA